MKTNNKQARKYHLSCCPGLYTRFPCWASNLKALLGKTLGVSYFTYIINYDEQQVASDKQNVRAACSKDKLLFKIFWLECWNVPQKRCCQSICGGQGIVLEIYGGAQGISLPSLSKDKLLFKIFSSFVIGVQCSTKTMLSINMW